MIDSRRISVSQLRVGSFQPILSPRGQVPATVMLDSVCVKGKGRGGGKGIVFTCVLYLYVNSVIFQKWLCWPKVSSLISGPNYKEKKWEARQRDETLANWPQEIWHGGVRDTHRTSYSKTSEHSRTKAAIIIFVLFFFKYMVHYSLLDIERKVYKQKGKTETEVQKDLLSIVRFYSNSLICWNYNSR